MANLNQKIICQCADEKILSQKVTKKIPIGKQEILLGNVDAKVCEKCGEIYFDGEMILALEAEIQKKQTKLI